MDKTFKIGDEIIVGECDLDEWKSLNILDEHNKSWKGCKGKIVSINIRSNDTVTYKCEIINNVGFEMFSSFTSKELSKMKPEYIFNIKIK